MHKQTGEGLVPQISDITTVDNSISKWQFKVKAFDTDCKGTALFHSNYRTSRHPISHHIVRRHTLSHHLSVGASPVDNDDSTVTLFDTGVYSMLPIAPYWLCINTALDRTAALGI